uniref:Uncharacterized protein n=1 Tax=Arundo donax TaxID=35708 RepID=A0A0A9E5Y4_ARUDO
MVTRASSHPPSDLSTDPPLAAARSDAAHHVVGRDASLKMLVAANTTRSTMEGCSTADANFFTLGSAGSDRQDMIFSCHGEQ